MASQSVWRDLVLGYRKKHSLTQADAAARLQVSQQTISRWESGKQEPDPDAQAALRGVLGLLALNVRDAWMQRISLSAGREHLFEKGWRIIAVSSKIAEADAFIEPGLVGKSLADIPFFAPVLDAVDGSGLFEGALKLLKIRAELHFDTRSVGRVVDYWPILTGTDEILVHGVAYPFAVDRPKVPFVGIRVLETEVHPLDPKMSMTRRTRFD